MSNWYNKTEIESKKVNMKVEYDPTPIRHLAVQCPDCKNWFYGYDILKGDCMYEYQLFGAECHCPNCGSEFKVDYQSNIEASGEFPEFYDKCLQEKTTWE